MSFVAFLALGYDLQLGITLLDRLEDLVVQASAPIVVAVLPARVLILGGQRWHLVDRPVEVLIRGLVRASVEAVVLGAAVVGPDGQLVAIVLRRELGGQKALVVQGDRRDFEVAAVVLEDLLSLRLVSRQRLEGITAARHVEIMQVALAA